jgi:uncharacterized membrane protein
MSPVALLHVGGATTAIASGAFVIFWRKGKAVHRLGGLIYVFAMLLTNICALMIYRLTGRFGVFHIFAILSLAYTFLGLVAPILRQPKWLMAHVQWMGWSYLSLLAAALNEALIRLPLHLDTPPRAISVGIALGVIVTGTGLALRPRLQRLAQDYVAVR